MTPTTTDSPKPLQTVRARFAGWPMALVAILVCVAVFHGATVVQSFDVVHPETPTFLKHNQQLVNSIPDAFRAAPLYPGLYRPLTTTLYYYLGRSAFGTRTAPYKVINALFFCANAFLLFLIARLVLPYAWSLVTALLFVSRRAHAELLLYSIEFQTLLSVFFCLLALYAFARSRRDDSIAFEAVSYLSLILALLSKEPAVMFVAVFFVYGWLFDRKWEWRPYLVHLALAIGWGRWYFFQFRAASDYRVVEFDYSWAPLDLARNYIGHLLDFVGFLMGGRTHGGLGIGPALESVAGSTGWQVVFIGTAIATVTFLSMQRRSAAGWLDAVRPMAFGYALFLLSMVPYVIVQGRLFVRYSYVGHVGVALAVAGLGALAVTLIRRRRGA